MQAFPIGQHHQVVGPRANRGSHLVLPGPHTIVAWLRLRSCSIEDKPRNLAREGWALQRIWRLKPVERHSRILLVVYQPEPARNTGSMNRLAMSPIWYLIYRVSSKSIDGGAIRYFKAALFPGFEDDGLASLGG